MQLQATVLGRWHTFREVKAFNFFRTLPVTGYIRGHAQTHPNKKPEKKVASTTFTLELWPINPIQDATPKRHQSSAQKVPLQPSFLSDLVVPTKGSSCHCFS